MQMVEDPLKWYRGPWQCPEEFPVSEIMEKESCTACSADLSPGPHTKVCREGTHHGVGKSHGICSSTHPGLRFLFSCCFPSFLFLAPCSVLPVTQAASRFPACILPAGPELPQAVSPVEFCPLSFPGSAISVTWCRGPLDTISSWGKRVKWSQAFFK